MTNKAVPVQFMHWLSSAVMGYGVEYHIVKYYRT